MGGFNYGGAGDGTRWSSEKGDGPTPGGGTGTGGAGGSGGSGGNSPDTTNTPEQQQWSKIMNDNTVKKKMDDLLNAARSLYPSTVLRVETLSPDGVLGISVTGLTADQAKQIGLSGSIMSFNLSSGLVSIGYFPTGIELGSGNANTENQSAPVAYVDNLIANTKKSDVTADDKVKQATDEVSKQQNRLNNAVAEIPKIQAEIAEAQKTFDEAKARSKQYERYARDPTSDGFRHWQRAGMDAQKAESTIKDASNRLTNMQNENVAAQKALDDAHIALTAANAEKQATQNNLNDLTTLKDAVQFTVDFYKEVTKKYSAAASQLASDFAAQAQGKTIRGVDQALAAFNKYQGSLGSKFGTKDRDAIIAGLNSITAADMAKNLEKFNKAFVFAGIAMNLVDISLEVKKALETSDWRPVFVKLETIGVGTVAGSAVASVFALMTGLSLGIIGFGLMIALIGALITDELVESINVRLGI